MKSDLRLLKLELWTSWPDNQYSWLFLCLSSTCPIDTGFYSKSYSIVWPLNYHQVWKPNYSLLQTIFAPNVPPLRTLHVWSSWTSLVGVHRLYHKSQVWRVVWVPTIRPSPVGKWSGTGPTPSLITLPASNRCPDCLKTWKKTQKRPKTSYNDLNFKKLHIMAWIFKNIGCLRKAWKIPKLKWLNASY